MVEFRLLLSLHLRAKQATGANRQAPLAILHPRRARPVILNPSFRTVGVLCKASTVRFIVVLELWGSPNFC